MNASSERLPSFDTSGALPTQSEFEKFAASDAIAALQASIIRSQREFRGFRGTFVKQERIGGTLHPPEEIAYPPAQKIPPYALAALFVSMLLIIYLGIGSGPIMRVIQTGLMTFS